MIVGIGTDVIRIARIEHMLTRFEQRFRERVFTKQECEVGDAISNPMKQNAYYAKRFAAKEAFSKALGTGFRDGIAFADVEVVKGELGKPKLSLVHSSVVSRYLADKVPEGTVPYLHLSLSDDEDVAQAFVIIEAR